MADYDTGVNLLSQGLNKGLADYSKILANGKIADSMVKTNPELLQTLGMDPDQFGALSAQDKSSTIAGVMQAQGAQMERQKTQAILQDYLSQAQERENIGKWRAAQGAAAAATASEDEDAGDFVKNFFAAEPDADATNPFQDRVNQALQATPKIGGKSFNRALQIVSQYGNQDQANTAPEIDKDTPYPGVAIVRDRKSGAIHVVQDPATAVTQLTDENGDIVPGGFVGRGGNVRFAPKGNTTDPSLIDERTQTALKTWHARLDPVLLQLDYATGKVSDPKVTPADKTKYGNIATSLAKQRDTILSERPKLADSASPAPGAAATATQYTKDKPADLGSDDEADKNFAALPTGAWFINPKDKKVLQKK